VNSLNGNAGVESEPAQPKSKSKVKLNFGLSPDFSIQLKVSLSESLSERLSQKLKRPNVSRLIDVTDYHESQLRNMTDCTATCETDVFPEVRSRYRAVVFPALS